MFLISQESEFVAIITVFFLIGKGLRISLNEMVSASILK